MAEFCLDCYNKLNETNFGEGTVELDYDLKTLIRKRKG